MLVDCTHEDNTVIPDIVGTERQSFTYFFICTALLIVTEGPSNKTEFNSIL